LQISGLRGEIRTHRGNQKTINHERSPVLLTEEEQFSTWLTGTPEHAFTLIKTSDPERMRIVQSGFDKEDLIAA
jgi:putative SOS response-associated peptidase YedK